jgi:hypothetical protein
MAIEEHQVRYRCAVERLVDAKQALDRCSGAALRLWVQAADAHDARYCVSVTTGG